MSACKPQDDKCLEWPFSSIGIWNPTKFGTLRDPFIEDDKALQLNIENLDSEFRKLKERNGVLAHKSEDLKKSRKRNKVYETEKISFSLLDDNIHHSLFAE